MLVDNRTKKYIFPIRIALSEGNIQGLDGLCIQKPKLQVSLFPSDNMLKVKGKSFFVLDFGIELHGGIRLLTFLVQGKNKVRIRFGESLSECCAEIGEKNATNDHSLRDFEVDLINFSDVEYGSTGFRFVRLDFNENTELYLTGAVAAFVYRDIPYLGSFECSDNLVNKIYTTARYTCHLNMQNMLWDGIKRDRLVWIGDMHTEMLTITDVFGNDYCIEEALSYSQNEAKNTKWMNGIPAYSVWWILILAEYIIRTGNKDYAKKYTDYIYSVLNQFDNNIDSDGNFIFDKNEEMSYYFDWPTHKTEDGKKGVNALVIWGIKEIKKLFNLLEYPCGICEKLLQKLSNSYKVSNAKQVVAMQYIAGLNPVNAKEALSYGNAKGLSSFMSYYILRATADCCGVKKALHIMKEYFGGMLFKGATTFWEDFDVEWMNGSCNIDDLPKINEKDIHGDFGRFCYQGFRHSLCHGWASGAVPFLTEYISGGKLINKNTLQIEPNLCDLKWVKCKLPTAFGIVEWEVYDNWKEIIIKQKPKEINIKSSKIIKYI